MLLSSTYHNQSFVEFLNSVIQEDSLKIENGFLHVNIVYKNNDEKEKILNFLSRSIVEDDQVNCKLVIKKSDLVYLKSKIHNPFRAAANNNEYNVRLMMCLIYELTDCWKTHCIDIYNTIKSSYQHDQRKQGGFFQQLLNYMLKNSECSGRMSKYCVEELMPLYFPNPELLSDKLQIHYSGTYVLFLSNVKTCKDSVLFKVVTKTLHMLKLENTKLSDDSALLKISDQKKCLENFIHCMLSLENNLSFNNLLPIPFHVFQETLSILASNQTMIEEIEVLLKERQQRDITNHISCKFFLDKGLNVVDFTDKVLEEAYHIYRKLYGKNSQKTALAIEEVISSLQNIQAHITANLDFFIEMNGNKGILRAQQYFRGLTILINAEINFLVKFKNILTSEDLDLFLKITCKDVHYDINQLLIAYDFFVHKKIFDRNAILKVTKKEISELTKYVNIRVLLLKEILRYMNNNIKIKNIDEFFSQRVVGSIVNDNPMLREQLINKDGKLISSVNLSNLLDSIEYVNGKCVAKKEEQKKWLLSQLKLHPLMDYLDIDHLNFPDELWCKELDDDVFFGILKSVIKSHNTDNKFFYDIKISKSLRILQILYKVSCIIPFSSLWLYYINPSRYRTVSGYIGNSIKEKLYTMNKKIPITSFSSKIIKNLKLDASRERFIQSYYEARFLKKIIRKNNNIAGHFEKLATKLSSNKFLAYLFLGVVFVIVLVCAIVSRVLIYFNIIPGIFLNKLISGIQGIFDTVFVVIGLDTIVDNVLILILNTTGIIIRILDFILLCGLLSEFVRSIVSLIYLVCHYVYKICVSICESLKMYGLKDSLIILLDNVWFTKRKASKDCRQEADVNQKCDINSHLMEVLEQIYDKTKNNSSLSVRINSMIKGLSSQIDQILCCGRPKFEILLDHFENNTSNLPQDTVGNINYIKLKYEFSYLLNNYVEKVNYCSNECNLNIMNSFQKRTECYDKITAINLQTKYFRRDLCNKIYNSYDIMCIFAKVNLIANTISVKSLNAKIASLKWAIHMLDVYDVYHIKNKSELVFLNTKIEHIITVMLYDCILRLENYRIQLQGGKLISVNFIDTDIESNFLPYIRDVYHILQSLDDNKIFNGQTESMRIFCHNFLDENSLLLKESSDQATNLSTFIQVNNGTISCVSSMKKYICEFMEYFQDATGIAISFMLYSLLYLTNSVTMLSVADYITQITDHVLDAVMLGELYDYFIRTDFGKLLLIEFYQKGILFKDIVFMCSEFNFGLLYDDVQVMQSHLYCHNVNYFIYSSSFHRVNIAQNRISLAVNGFVRILYEILLVGLVQQVIRYCRKKEVYNLECFMLREKIVSDLMSFDVKEISDCSFVDQQLLSVEKKLSCSERRHDLKIDHMLRLDERLEYNVVKY